MADASRDQEFRAELEGVINRCSLENGSNTPDFILAEYLTRCLAAYDAAVRHRESWYGRPIVSIASTAGATLVPPAPEDPS